MSYPLNLDEYPTKRLREELAARRHLRRKGLCDYCVRDPSTPPCKFPERHKRHKAVQEREPLLLRFMKFLRDNNRKPGVLSEDELRRVIADFRVFTSKAMRW